MRLQRSKNTDPDCCRFRFPAANTRSSCRMHIGCAPPDWCPPTSTTSRAPAKWDPTRTRTPLWIRNSECLGSKASGWLTLPSCPSYRLDTPMRWLSWSVRKRPTWSRKTGSNDSKIQYYDNDITATRLHIAPTPYNNNSWSSQNRRPEYLPTYK